MTLSKSPALDPKPVKKSGRERFPFLQVQHQCELVRHVPNSLFSSFFGELKIGQSTPTSCIIALGQGRKCFKSLRTLFAHKLTVVFSCLGTGRDTRCLCQAAQHKAYLQLGWWACLTWSASCSSPTAVGSTVDLTLPETQSFKDWVYFL